MKRHSGMIAFAGLILLVFSSLTAPKGYQEHHIEITPEQDRYVIDDDNPVTFTITADPNSAICVEVTNDNRRFDNEKLRTGKDFFSSYFGGGGVNGVDIKTDDNGDAQYALPSGPLREMMSGHTKLYYRACIIDPQTASRERKRFDRVAISLEDSDWQTAPSLQVYSSAEEEDAADMVEAARVPYRKGVELYKQKKFEAAIDELLKAKDIADRGNIEYFLCYSYLQMGLGSARKAYAHPTTSEEAKQQMKHIIDLLESVLD